MKTILFPTLPLLAAFAFMSVEATAQVPEPVSIQGVAETAGGEPLTGTRAWRVRFYSDATGTTQLGSDLTGTTALSDRGRFSFVLVPPSSALAATDLHYAIAVDGNTPRTESTAATSFPVWFGWGAFPLRDARRAP